MGKLIAILIIFLVIGGYIIYKKLNTDFEDNKERITFLSEFGSWVLQVGSSAKNTVGYAIEQKWLPNINKTNETSLEK
jgi:hypothetical protein